MVHIITGEINSGKTTKLLSIYNKIKNSDSFYGNEFCDNRFYGDGFYSDKVYMNKKYAGQMIKQLSTGKSKVLCLKREFVPEGWKEKDIYFDYSFSQEGLEFAENIVLDLIKKKSETVFIDEIGPLELKNKGFSQIFRLLLSELSKNKEIYVVIRQSCVNSVVNSFDIENYNLIKVDNMKHKH